MRRSHRLGVAVVGVGVLLAATVPVGPASGLAASAPAAAAAGSTPTAAVPVPEVVGPLPSGPAGSPSRDHTFFATDLGLERRGFVEEELFLSGTANVYDERPEELEPDPVRRPRRDRRRHDHR